MAMKTVPLLNFRRPRPSLGNRPPGSGFGLSDAAVRIAALFLLVLLGGCASMSRGDAEDEESNAKLEKLLKVPAPPDLIREAAVPKGLNQIRVDGVALVNHLVGTGGAPEPSTLRDQLLEDMRRHDVANPNHILEQSDTAMVQVRGVIPPGARSGDPIDLLVVAPAQSHVRDLHGGWLMQTRLRHQQVLRGAVRQSSAMAFAQGPILTQGDYLPGADSTLQTKGLILAGGRVTESRELGLVLRPEFQHVKMSAAIAAAINRRFYFFDGSTRRGIAKPMEDDYIRLDVHPRYRGNEHRLIEVVRAIGVKPESAETQSRLAELGRQISDPATAADAALQLEGMGDGAIPTLIKTLESDNPELRFYAAETLAYLDREESIAPLENAIRDTAAFRFPALLALEGVEDRGAVDALRRLMDQPSLETRYGAFCAIRRRPDGAPTLAGENVSGQFRFFVVPSTAEPAVVVSLRRSPEIVVFGEDPSVNLTAPIFGPGGLLIKQDVDHPGKLRISRFLPGQEDQIAIVDPSIPGLVHGIASVGAGYGDVIAVLRAAKDRGFLSQQLAMDPLPKPLRTYHREKEIDGES